MTNSARLCPHLLSCLQAAVLEEPWRRKKEKPGLGVFLASAKAARAWLPPGMSVPSCECQRGNRSSVPKDVQQPPELSELCGSWCLLGSCHLCSECHKTWGSVLPLGAVPVLGHWKGWSAQKLSTGAPSVHFPKPGLLQEVLVRGQGLDQLSKVSLELPCAWQAGRNHSQNRAGQQCPLMGQRCQQSWADLQGQGERCAHHFLQVWGEEISCAF